MNTTKRVLLLILTFPFIIALYLTDRVVTLPLLWLNAEPIQTWVESAEKITRSFLRVLITSIVWGLFELVHYLVF